MNEYLQNIIMCSVFNGILIYVSYLFSCWRCGSSIGHRQNAPSCSSVFLSLQTPPGPDDPADAEPAVVPDQEVPRWAGLPQRRQAPLPEPVGETAREHLLLRGCLLLRQDGPPPQGLGECSGEEEGSVSQVSYLKGQITPQSKLHISPLNSHGIFILFIFK